MVSFCLPWNIVNSNKNVQNKNETGSSQIQYGYLYHSKDTHWTHHMIICLALIFISSVRFFYPKQTFNYFELFWTVFCLFFFLNSRSLIDRKVRSDKVSTIYVNCKKIKLMTRSDMRRHMNKNLQGGAIDNDFQFNISNPLEIIKETQLSFFF